MPIPSVSTSAVSAASPLLFPPPLPEISEELELEIFSYLPIKKLASVQKVSKYWEKLAIEKLKDISRQLGLDYKNLEGLKNFVKYFAIELKQLDFHNIRLRQLDFQNLKAMYMEACRVRSSGEYDYYDFQEIFELPLITKPWEEVVLEDFVDTAGIRLVPQDLTLEEIKSTLNPSYVLRWLLLMAKETPETYYITDTNAAVIAFLSGQCFQAALDTLKEPNFTIRSILSYLYLAVSMGKLNGPWHEVNENDAAVCIDIIDHLIEAGGLEINQVRRKHTALTRAVPTGSKKIVECLINHGANVNLARADGVTPLILAIEAGHMEIVECLINHNADVNLAGADGKTPLALAIELGHREIVEYLRNH